MAAPDHDAIHQTAIEPIAEVRAIFVKPFSSTAAKVLRTSSIALACGDTGTTLRCLLSSALRGHMQRAVLAHGIFVGLDR
ncbi:MAG: hypothetical protein ACI9DC_004246 [Gammaproteobacteria bacterium]|jgi:hypothetical protein